MINFPASIWGAIFGAALGMSIIFPRVWIVAIPLVIGFVIGKILESKAAREKLRDLISQMFNT